VKILGLKLAEFILSEVIARRVMLYMIFTHGYTAPTWPCVLNMIVSCGESMGHAVALGLLHTMI
jgi:hypothetical protein